MINESCTPIPHSMRSDVDLHAASPVAQNKQGRVQDLASKQLSILQCNINGLCSTATKIKLEEIMEIAEKQKIQIIALQETKLNEKYNLKYKNYNILRKDRNKEGGGLAFLIKNLYYEDIAINIPNTSDLEAQGIKVYLNQNKTINIFNMYHPPNNKLIDDGTMAQFLTDNTIIVGDLNAKHQLWGCSTPNPRGKILSNLFDDNAFMCLNDGNPTHHSYSYNTAQALDISFSSPDIFHKCKWQILKSIGSDHLPILIEISTKTKTSSIKEKFWNFKKANWNLYQQNTNEDFRKAPTRIKDLEQNWISFKNTIIKAAKVSIPRGNIKKWIPNYTHQAKDIQTLITKRNELQKKYTQNQTNCRTELNIVNAKIKRLYVNMKREKWKQTCENLNPRNPNTKLWHLAKQIDRAQPQTENTNMIENIDGTPATNDKNAANLLGNSYQMSSKIKFEIKDKVEKKARKIIHDCKNVTSTHNIFHEKINMKELDYALENTDLNKTPGPDGIHGQMISNLGKNGKEKLLDIFNNSWKTGKLPQDWKTATIIPIKKLDKSADDPKNYRPISLTSICCKLMEKIILRRLTYHLDTRNLLPEEQYGFRKGHGTIDQLLFFTQKTLHKLLIRIDYLTTVSRQDYLPKTRHPKMENQARSDATSEGNTTPSIVTDIVAQLAAALCDIVNPGQRDSDLPRYDGTYPAANFFQQYDDIADRAYLTGTKRLQKLPAQLSALKLTPQTALQGYYKEKTAMGLQLNLPTDIILESLTEGLPTADQRLVRTVSPNTLKDWHDLMARIKGSSVLAPVRPTPEPTSSRHDDHITLAREQPSRPYNMPPRFFSTPRLPRHADSSVPSQPPSPCHYCRGNHWNAQCPRRQPSGRNNVFYQETTGRQPRTSLSTTRSQPARSAPSSDTTVQTTPRSEEIGDTGASVNIINRHHIATL
ncbi:hypothetical protein LAZ67_20002350 [Cordylochernes scorpioides]|uniref:Reverse transcriptase domain-containing protein n=1 Tax=Cordylochernes scorpioides TaxID=51811 RepID=A0ABY6LN71_9ARAC|nr:hypothetical protein LAZ67_20002350 [Cordylochernes scorpioides]